MTLDNFFFTRNNQAKSKFPGICGNLKKALLAVTASEGQERYVMGIDSP